ncbi:hypothetical protein ACHAXS_003263 [Conticribra weissflogii]
MTMKSAAQAAILPFVWACLLSPCFSMHNKVVEANAHGNANVNPGIVTLPLLSHQHVVHRHLAELSSTAHGRRLIAARNLTAASFDRLPFYRPRDRSLSSPSQQLAPLYQGYGTHYLDLWVGLPAPQRQTAVVDTGSSATAFPCLECRDCGTHADPPFNETASQSFRISVCPREPCAFGSCDVKGTCLVAHEYGSGVDASSWIAFEAQDAVYAGGSHDEPLFPVDDGASLSSSDPRGELPAEAPLFSFPLTFGCQTATSGYFRKQLASGVVGLDRKAQSFWGQMRASQVIHRAQFSLCFVRQPVASFSGTGAGAVSFGGADPRLHATPMVFAKAMGHGSTASFKVRVRKMYLGENGGGSGAESVMYDATTTVHRLEVEEEDLNGKEEFNFDSGTTDTYFTKALSDEFRRIWRDVTGRDYDNDEVEFSDADLRKLPTVFLQMVPHEGGVGDEFVADDPRAVPGLAGKVDVGLPNDVLFAIPPLHYMQPGSRSGVYASRIYLDRDDDMGSVLGSNAMMGYDILFDMDAARIGFAASDCDYRKVVEAAEKDAAEEAIQSNEASGTAAASASAAGSDAKVDDEESSGICGTLKCRGFFGLTLTIVFILFFVFARRYITRRDDGIKSNKTSASSRTSEYEMKSSGTSVTSRYSDDEIHLSGGERGGYHDTAPPPPRYSDRRRDSDGGDRDGGYRIGADRSSSGRSHYSHASASSSSSRRDYGVPRSDGSHRSQDSHHSARSGSTSGRTHGENRNYGADRSYGGDRSYSGSVQSHHSSRSQRSAGSHHSSRSQRSTGSHRSTSSRDSHRSHSSHRSSSSRNSRSSSHDRGGSGGSGSRRYRDDYDDDEIPMPPTIS